MRDAILRQRQFSKATRMVGYFIADHINFQAGYAWAGQERLAELAGVSIRTVARACIVLEDDGWFRRELSGRNWLYFPNWLRSETPDMVSGVQCRKTGHERSEHRTFATSNTGQTRPSNYSKNSSRRELMRGRGQQRTPDSAASIDEKESGQQEKVVATLPDQSAAITRKARRAGAPVFVFENSEPWRAWIEYRAAHGLGSMLTRQCMVDGRWRTGWDAPTLYPPRYRRATGGAA